MFDIVMVSVTPPMAADIAKATGFSRESIYKWMKGTRPNDSVIRYINTRIMKTNTVKHLIYFCLPALEKVKQKNI